MFGMQKLPEGVARRSSVKKVFLKTSQNSKENTCATVSFLIKLLIRTPFFKEHLLLNKFYCIFVENFYKLVGKGY